MAAFRLFSRLAISATLLAALLAVLVPANGSPPKVAGQDKGPVTRSVASTYFYPEVRLRKLHLVRPDLIPYPIYYEIYC